MSSTPRSRRTLIIVVLLLLTLVIAFFARCTTGTKKPLSKPLDLEDTGSLKKAGSVATPSTAPELAAEQLTSATVKAPAEITAGTAFRADWTGPNNPDDFLTIVPPDSPPSHYENHQLTSAGNSLTLTAPIAPGSFEVRYVTARSHTVLARAPLNVVAAAIGLSAPESVGAGSTVSISWSGPNNVGDFITVVPLSLPDSQYGNNELTSVGTPLKVLVPVESGEAEIRYLSGQGRAVLARRPLTITRELATLEAQETIVAGKMLSVSWKGPNNRGDYITIVPKTKPDGQYGNHELTAGGPSVNVLAPMEAGPAEIRYMTGQGHKVLTRRSLLIVAADVRLEAPATALAGSDVSVAWQGPNNRGDYLTFVLKTTRDGNYGNYTDTTKGSPLIVTAPIDPGDAEIRYMSGQGAHVLARFPIKLEAAAIALSAPDEIFAGDTILIDCTGPNQRGDYLTIVPKGTKDGIYTTTAQLNAGKPFKIVAPTAAGPAEIRYMSGQGNKVLARRPLQVNTR